MFSFFYVVKEDYRGKEEVDGGGGWGSNSACHVGKSMFKGLSSDPEWMVTCWIAAKRWRCLTKRRGSICCAPHHLPQFCLSLLFSFLASSSSSPSSSSSSSSSSSCSSSCSSSSCSSSSSSSSRSSTSTSISSSSFFPSSFSCSFFLQISLLPKHYPLWMVLPPSKPLSLLPLVAPQPPHVWSHPIWQRCVFTKTTLPQPK